MLTLWWHSCTRRGYRWRGRRGRNYRRVDCRTRRRQTGGDPGDEAGGDCRGLSAASGSGVADLSQVVGLIGDALRTVEQPNAELIVTRYGQLSVVRVAAVTRVSRRGACRRRHVPPCASIRKCRCACCGVVVLKRSMGCVAPGWMGCGTARGSGISGLDFDRGGGLVHHRRVPGASAA
jgi:hypothetical protein